MMEKRYLRANEILVMEMVGKVRPEITEEKLLFYIEEDEIWSVAVFMNFTFYYHCN